MSDFDRQLVTGLLPAAPGSADWTDVLARAGTRQPRRRLVVVLAAVALVVAVGAVSALAVRAFYVDKGFIGLPPEGATPSAPAEGELVFGWVARTATRNGLLLRASVYTDGRIIWQGHNVSIPESATDGNTGLLEQRLTPEGIELLRSKLVASGLFDRSRTLVIPDEQGFHWGEVELQDGDRLVRLQWNMSAGGEAATAGERSALLSIDRVLGEPASVLPASAWADRTIRAYVPSHYAACMHASPPEDASVLLARLPTRAADLLRAKNLARSEYNSQGPEGGGDVWVSYCAKLPTEEAREFAEALAGLEREDELHWSAGPVRDGRLSILISPYLPHGAMTCAGCG